MTHFAVSTAPTFERFRLGRRPHLDGVRGLAIALVLLRHAGTPGTQGSGTIGVDIFFVLSGFLITSLLLEEWEKNGRISLRKFYARRALRLYPALVVMLVAFMVGALIFGADMGVATVSALAALTYTTPIAIPLTEVHPSLVPMWTLATEEWFYLVWPLALIAILRFKATTKNLLLWAGGAVAVFTAVKLGSFLTFGPDIYTSPSTWADALLGGCVLAVLLNRLPMTWRLPAWAPYAALGLLAFMSAWSGTRYSVIAYGGMLTLAWIAGAVLIVTAIQRPNDLAARWMLNPVARWLGTRSYGIYLWNGLFLLTGFTAPVPGPVQALAGVTLSLIAAELSWRFVEQPALKLKHRFKA